MSVLGVGKLQEDYLDFLQNVVASTKEMNGATETALGNVTPQNTSAILAIQAASQIPLKFIRAALYQCIEDLANIWADMTISYFAADRLVPMLDLEGNYVAESLSLQDIENVKFSAEVKIEDTSVYDSSITISILDKLLDRGYITVDQYLEKIPGFSLGNHIELIGGVGDE